MAEYTIALAGNPNTGKSTIFNALTGSNQHTGNWPGKTVAQKAGIWRWENDVFNLVDLPGAYSLSAFSLEEAITRDFILDQHPDLVVVVTDATNLERNLYLVVQILEMTSDMIVVLNMQDIVQAQGLDIDVPHLEQRLGVPVVPMAARQGEGIPALKAAIAQSVRSLPAHAQNHGFIQIDYGADMEAAIAELQAAIRGYEALDQAYPRRWLALKLLAGDEKYRAIVADTPGAAPLLNQAETLAEPLQALWPEELDTIMADRRYTWIHSLVGEAIHQRQTHHVSLTDRIDRVVTHPVGGLVVFFGLMWMVFKLSTDVAAPYVGWITDLFSGPLTQLVTLLLTWLRLDGTWFASLITDGIMAGIGGVLVFVPVLMFLYLGLALLEDSGYMARAAFVMDRHMRRLGLHGKSFVPLVLGFGCNVPAVYATRTLESEKDRLLTGMLIPFMSCGARLPVYVLIANIFFPRYRSVVILAMYMLGIFFAVFTGILLRKTIFKGKADAGMLMELPSYRLPAAGNVWREMWARTRGFLAAAGRIIILVSMVIWFLMAIPTRPGEHFTQTPIEHSAFAALANGLTPIFQPLGFGNWQSSSALLSGLVAKEVIISTTAQVYHLDNTGQETPLPSLLIVARTSVVSFLQATLDTVRALPSLIGLSFGNANNSSEVSGLALAVRKNFETSSQGYGALAGLAFMVFILLYTPCVATIAAQRQEFGGRWAAASVVLQLSVAWMAAWLVFQGGRWLV